MEKTDQTTEDPCKAADNWDTWSLRKDADCFAISYGLRSDSATPGWNDGMDAFRHAYASAVTARDHGATAAKMLGMGHEAVGVLMGESTHEMKMDLQNNTTGRELARRLGNAASNDMIASAVAVAYRAGLLVTKPGDMAPSIDEMPTYSPKERAVILDRIAENITATHEASTLPNQQLER